MRRSLLPALAPAALVGLLALGAVLAGLLPLAVPMGFAAGGVLETGQVEPMRWWLGALAAVIAYVPISWQWSRWRRLGWLVALVMMIAGAVLAFAYVASSGQHRVVAGGSGADEALRVGAVTALPLFWPEGKGIGELLAGVGEGGPAPVTSHKVRAIDHVDATTLAGLDALLIAQPRLFRPEELVALDHWIGEGGRALIFADPLLLWPSVLPPGDPRRPPLTSLLDPLLAHWGVRLEPARRDAAGVERRMLDSGHVMLLAGASRFTVVDSGERRARCALAGRGLMALCRVGRGEVRLVADADLLDERLWLADPRHPHRPETWSADIPVLVDAWLARPLQDPAVAAPLRATTEAALTRAMRAALLALLLGVGLSSAASVLAGQGLLYRNGMGGGNGKGTKFRGERKTG